MRSHMTWCSLALVIGLAGCGDDSPAGPGGETVVTGSIESESEPMSASPQLAPSSPAQQVQGEARTVVIGQVASGGTFTSYAQAAVQADGSFRLEGVPAGRSELVIRARNDAGAEIGSVVIHETTVASVEHEAQPITARTTVHARAWTEMRTSNSASAMGSSELALFTHFQSETTARAATSAERIEAIAGAAVHAQSTITAVLAAEGHSMSAQARTALLLEAAAIRDADQSAGVSAETAHRAYVEAALQAYEGASVSGEALVLAYAAAATSFDQALAESSAGATARLDMTREAVFVSLRARARAAASTQGSVLGLRSATIVTIEQMEARVLAAQSVAQIRTALEEEQAEVEGRAVAAVFASIPGLGGIVGAQVEAQLRSAIGASDLWVDLDGATTAQASAQATQAFRGRVQTSVTAFIASLPAQTQSTVSASALVRLMICLGGGASIG